MLTIILQVIPFFLIEVAISANTWTIHTPFLTFRGLLTNRVSGKQEKLRIRDNGGKSRDIFRVFSTLEKNNIVSSARDIILKFVGKIRVIFCIPDNSLEIPHSHYQQLQSYLHHNLSVLSLY